MNKTTALSSSILALTLLIGSALPSWSQSESIEPMRMAFVDFSRLQRDFYRTYEERDKYESNREAELKRLEDPRQRLRDLMQRQDQLMKEFQDPTLSEERRQKIMSEAEQARGQMLSLQRETMEMENKIQAQLNSSAEAIQRSITKEIYEKVGEIATAQDLDLVLNRTFGMMGVPTVAFSSTKRLPDLTDQVLAALNANAPADWSPPEAG